MIFLFLSVITSVIAVVFFKLFDKFKVNTLEAIVTNYITAALLGFYLSQKPANSLLFWQQDWFVYTLVLGFLFISVFSSIAYSTQKIGVSITMVASKLSVAIPIMFAVLFFNEEVGLYKLAGIILSMIAVYFISKTGKYTATNQSKLWIIPLIVFVGSGFTDAVMNALNEKFIPQFDTSYVLSFAFLTAFTFGSIILFLRNLKTHRSVEIKSIGWGIALGVPNYFCMFFLLKALTTFAEASFVLPVNNIAIVMVSALVGTLIFKETLTKLNIIGLILAVVSILLLSLNL
ncbi:MAG: DMT family transporter [Bacteroidia bacterium]|nr:DMT family transporter [Bacteroidia bacterium]